jgi:hypothetical protein
MGHRNLLPCDPTLPQLPLLAAPRSGSVRRASGFVQAGFPLTCPAVSPPAAGNLLKMRLFGKVSYGNLSAHSIVHNVLCSRRVAGGRWFREARHWFWHSSSGLERSSTQRNHKSNPQRRRPPANQPTYFIPTLVLSSQMSPSRMRMTIRFMACRNPSFASSMTNSLR